MKSIFIVMIGIMAWECTDSPDGNKNIVNAPPKKDILIPSFSEQISNYISYCDSAAKQSNSDREKRFVSILFQQSRDSCIIWLINSFYYAEDNLDGYIMLGEKMILFHNLKSPCSKGFVIENRLLKQIPEDYKNPEIMDYEDPKVRKLLVKSNNQFEIIYEGSF